MVEVNNLPDVDGTKAFLNEKTGMRTYPKTFVNGKLIGGNSELQGLVKSGKFQKMLKWIVLKDLFYVVDIQLIISLSMIYMTKIRMNIFSKFIKIIIFELKY